MTGENDEGMRVSMGLVEAIGKAGTEYDQCLKRQQKLLEDLKEKRSSRLSKQIKENASILNLVQAWRHEENRMKLLKLGELEQKLVLEEVDKMMNMSEVRCLILGLNKEDFQG
jgi:secreted Zn-dependent insulinase-like peptidase